MWSRRFMRYHLESIKQPLDDLHNFSVFDSNNYSKLGSCSMRYPIFDLTFDDEDQNFLAIEITGKNNEEDYNYTISEDKLELRHWMMGRKFRGPNESNPYEDDVNNSSEDSEDMDLDDLDGSNSSSSSDS